MNITRTQVLSASGLALVFVLGCGRASRQTSEHDRKEAVQMVSEAEFAMSVREWARAEDLFAKAVRLTPNGDYWLGLGAARLRLNNRAGAKDAYLSALKAYENDAARNQALPDPWLKQAVVLALLGRNSDGQAVLIKAANRFPNDMKLRALTDPKEFEKVVSGQKFKDMAL